MSNELNCRMGKDELTWSGAWWRRQSCGWLVHWLGNASFFPSVLLCFLSWSWFLVSGNFENENVRKNGLLNAFLLLSSSFLLLCEWFVPVLLVFIDLLCSLRYVSVRLLFVERQTKTMIYEVRWCPLSYLFPSLWPSLAYQGTAPSAPVSFRRNRGTNFALPRFCFFPVLLFFSPPVPQFFFFSRLSLFLLLVIPPPLSFRSLAFIAREQSVSSNHWLQV